MPSVTNSRLHLIHSKSCMEQSICQHPNGADGGWVGVGGKRADMN